MTLESMPHFLPLRRLWRAEIDPGANATARVQTVTNSYRRGQSARSLWEKAVLAQSRAEVIIRPASALGMPGATARSAAVPRRAIEIPLGVEDMQRFILAGGLAGLRRPVFKR
jgi:hypothetical protein